VGARSYIVEVFMNVNVHLAVEVDYKWAISLYLSYRWSTLTYSKSADGSARMV